MNSKCEASKLPTYHWTQWIADQKILKQLSGLNQFFLLVVGELRWAAKELIALAERYQFQ